MPGKFSFTLTPDAEDEYLQSFAWYEEQRTGLGKRFKLSVRKKFQLITNNPELYGKKKGRYHEALLSKSFPFVIIYTINRKQKNITITSIFHTSRSPRKKYRN